MLWCLFATDEHKFNITCSWMLFFAAAAAAVGIYHQLLCFQAMWEEKKPLFVHA